MSNLWNSNSARDEQLQCLYAQQADIQAKINSLQRPPSSKPNRSPIQKQQSHRSHVSGGISRSMSVNGSFGTSMARHPSSGRVEVPLQRPRTKSQATLAAPSMARTTPRGVSSAHSGNLPFIQVGNSPPTPPLFRSEQTMMAESWNPLAASQPPSHSIPQRSLFKRHIGLENVPETSEFMDPEEFIKLDPLSIPTVGKYRASIGLDHSLQYPLTPTAGPLTTPTAIDMNRTASLCHDKLLETMQMMSVASCASYADVAQYDESPYYSQPPMSSEDQTHFLAELGGVNHAQLQSFQPRPLSLSTSSTDSGQRMEKSDSNGSAGSSTSASSRNKQRLKESITVVRTIQPKGESSMSRNGLMSMSRLESQGAEKKVTKSYQRPKRNRVFCTECNDHPKGFRGVHELRRHQDRHSPTVKRWVIVDPAPDQINIKPVTALSRCKACSQLKKRYGKDYNAAAHLRRAHFKPREKGRNKSSKLEDSKPRGGSGSGDWPSMLELRKWMVEVEEVPPLGFSGTQQSIEDEEEEEELDDALDGVESSPDQAMEITSTGFDTASMLGELKANTVLIPTDMQSQQDFISAYVLQSSNMFDYSTLSDDNISLHLDPQLLQTTLFEDSALGGPDSILFAA